MMKSLSNLFKKSGGQRKQAKSEYQKAKEIEAIKQIQHRAAMLKIDNPDWDRNRLFEVAEKQILG